MLKLEKNTLIGLSWPISIVPDLVILVFLSRGGVGNASEGETLRIAASKRFFGYDPVIYGYDEVHPLLEGSPYMNPSKRCLQHYLIMFLNQFKGFNLWIACLIIDYFFLLLARVIYYDTMYKKFAFEKSRVLPTLYIIRS